MHYKVLQPPGSGPCARRVVTAIVECTNGDTYEGTNYCERPQATCPRADMPTGVGYELCTSVCKQAGHAEQVALNLAGPVFAKEGTLKVIGHTYACEPCKTAALAHHIARLIVDGKEEPLSTPTGDCKRYPGVLCSMPCQCKPKPRTMFALGVNPFNPLPDHMG